MSNLVLLNSPFTKDDRIEAMVRKFQNDLMNGDSNMECANELIGVVIEYLCQYEDDPFLNQAFVKLNEAEFWLGSWLAE